MKTRYGALALAIACLIPAAAQAGMHKCVIEGKVTYQDIPCPGELGSAGGEPTAASTAVVTRPAPRLDTAALERKLDRLQGRGKGMVQRQPPGPVETPPPRQEQQLWRPRGSREQEAARIKAMLDEESARVRAKSTAKLNKLFADMEKACGGKPPETATIGMSDEFFRTCTAQARLGHVIQIVAVDEGKVPLRLYVFASGRASRVYSIGGVVTKVLP